jgi:uncharacterized protein involved in exopolysaccharide biosynthesis
MTETRRNMAKKKPVENDTQETEEQESAVEIVRTEDDLGRPLTRYLERVLRFDEIQDMREERERLDAEIDKMAVRLAGVKEEVKDLQKRVEASGIEGRELSRKVLRGKIEDDVRVSVTETKVDGAWWEIVHRLDTMEEVERKELPNHKRQGDLFDTSDAA